MARLRFLNRLCDLCDRANLWLCGLNNRGLSGCLHGGFLDGRSLKKSNYI